MVARIDKVHETTDNVSKGTIDTIKQPLQEDNLPELIANSSKSDREKTDFTGESFFEKHKRGIALGTIAVGILAYCIGRNPAKAAKILKGNTAIVGKKYSDAVRNSSKIVSKTKGLERLFRNPIKDNRLFKDTLAFEKFLKKSGEPADAEIISSIKTLKKRIAEFYKNLENDFISGKSRKVYRTGEEFVAQNKELLQKLDSYAKKADRWHRYDFIFDIEECKKQDFISYIRPCPKELLPKDFIFYHGTKSPKGVYKTGFTPFASNQFEGRELGAAVYITPDNKVASFFAIPGGSVIPMRLSKDAKIAIINEKTQQMLYSEARMAFMEYYGVEKAENIINSNLGRFNTEVECIMRDIMRSQGYDAAFTTKALKTSSLFDDFIPDVNSIMGRQQVQLAVYSPEKLEIIPRNIIERASDVKNGIYMASKAQIGAFRYIKNLIGMFFSKPKSA